MKPYYIFMGLVVIQMKSNGASKPYTALFILTHSEKKALQLRCSIRDVRWKNFQCFFQLTLFHTIYIYIYP